MTGILLTLVSRGSTTLAYTAVPVITGSPTERSVLSASNGVWLGAVPITYSYQWFSNSIPVGTASNTYTVALEDVGNIIYCRVSATNFYGTLTANSANTSIVGLGLPTKPVVTVSDLTETSATFTWTQSVSNVTQYDVYAGSMKINDSPITGGILTYSTITTDSINTRVFMNGEVLNDFSEKQNGFVNTSVTTNATKFAYGTTSFYFNGASKLLFSGGSTGIFGTSNFTIEFWLSSTSTALATGIVGLDFSSGTGAASWQVSINSVASNGKIYIALGSTNILVSTATVNDGTLRHIAIVRNSTTISIYIGGVLDSSVAIAAGAIYGDTTTTYGLVIGCRNTSTATYASFLTGYLDEMRISSTARYTAAFTPYQFQYGYRMMAKTAYTFYVKAVNVAGTTSSDAIAVVSNAKQPTGLVASSITNSSFTLSWTVTSGVSYTIFNGSTQIGSAQTTGNVAITGLSGATSYTFYVKATATGSSNAISSIGLPVLTAPAVPAAMTASNIGSSTLTLSWTQVAGLTYEVLNGSTSLVTGLSAGTYNVTGLTEASSYNFYLKASNASGTTQSIATSVQTTRIQLAVSVSLGASADLSLDWTWWQTKGVIAGKLYDITLTIGGGSRAGAGANTSSISNYLSIGGTNSGNNRINIVVASGTSIIGQSGGTDTNHQGGNNGGNTLWLSAAEIVTFTNYGTIYGGAGGGGVGGGNTNSQYAYEGDNGGYGGLAIYTDYAFTLYNYGTIEGGGGGGGGGAGAVNTSASTTVSNGSTGSGGSGGTGGNGGQGGGDGGRGGLSGAGGTGGSPGYNGSNGSSGVDGGNGSRAGGTGGAAGVSIYNRSRVTVAAGGVGRTPYN